MSTKREQILESILIKLKGLTTVADSKVDRLRIFPDDEKDCPSVYIEPIDDNEDEVSLGNFNHNLLVNIVVNSSGEIPDKCADPIVKEIRDILMSDRSLGGLAMNLSPKSVNFDFDRGEQGLVAVICVYEIFYRENY